MKIVIKPSRNLKDSLNTQNLIILRNVQHWLKSLDSYKKYKLLVIICDVTKKCYDTVLYY